MFNNQPNSKLAKNKSLQKLFHSHRPPIQGGHARDKKTEGRPRRDVSQLFPIPNTKKMALRVFTVLAVLTVFAVASTNAQMWAWVSADGKVVNASPQGALNVTKLGPGVYCLDSKYISNYLPILATIQNSRPVPAYVPRTPHAQAKQFLFSPGRPSVIFISPDTNLIFIFFILCFFRFINANTGWGSECNGHGNYAIFTTDHTGPADMAFSFFVPPKP